MWACSVCTSIVLFSTREGEVSWQPLWVFMDGVVIEGDFGSSVDEVTEQR